MSGFVDEAQVHVKAGNGGAGAVAFRREAHVDRGGPDGGDGGRGGDVWLVATTNQSSLLGFRDHPHRRATDGGHGGGKRRHGANGTDLEVPVPVGTRARGGDGIVLCDLVATGDRWLAGHGGRGGRGTPASSPIADELLPSPSKVNAARSRGTTSSFCSGPTWPWSASPTSARARSSPASRRPGPRSPTTPSPPSSPISASSGWTTDRLHGGRHPGPRRGRGRGQGARPPIPPPHHPHPGARDPVGARTDGRRPTRRAVPRAARRARPLPGRPARPAPPGGREQGRHGWQRQRRTRGLRALRPVRLGRDRPRHPRARGPTGGARGGRPEPTSRWRPRRPR